MKQHHIAFRESLHAIGVQNIGPTFQNYRHITDSYIAKEIYETDQQKPFSWEVYTQFEQELTSRISQIEFTEVPGAIRLIHLLQQSQVVSFCFATGSYRRPALHKLQSAGFEIDENLLVGADDLPEREQIVKKAIQIASDHYQISKFDRTVAIGDGLWDLLTARRLGLEFIGVGNEHASVLKENGAQTIFPDFQTFTF